MPRRAASLQTLVNQVDALWPNRSKASDGWIADVAHQARKSEHNPNKQGVVTAQDITQDPAHGADMGWLAEQLIKDARTWYVIWNRRIWENGKWAAYTGTSDPHTGHLHISVKQDPASYDNSAQWNLNKGGIKMTPELVSLIYQIMFLPNPSQQELEAGMRKTIDQLIFELDKDPRRRKVVGKVQDYDHLLQTATGLQEQLRVALKDGDMSSKQKLQAIRKIIGD